LGERRLRESPPFTGSFRTQSGLKPDSRPPRRSRTRGTPCDPRAGPNELEPPQALLL
jgi:hypothetical protein